MDESHGRKKIVLGLVQWFQLMDKLNNLIQNAGFHFDHVVAISKGGLEIGERLARLNKKPLAVVAAENWPNGQKRKEIKRPRHIVFTTETISGNILIVDDLPETGETLTATIEFIMEKFKIPRENIRTATLSLKSCTAVIPDFYVERIEPDTETGLYPWLVFPPENPEIVP